jgi:hypothetical protein
MTRITWICRASTALAVILSGLAAVEWWSYLPVKVFLHGIGSGEKKFVIHAECVHTIEVRFNRSIPFEELCNTLQSEDAVTVSLFAEGKQVHLRYFPHLRPAPYSDPILAGNLGFTNY